MECKTIEREIMRRQNGGESGRVEEDHNVDGETEEKTNRARR